MGAGDGLDALMDSGASKAFPSVVELTAGSVSLDADAVSLDTGAVSF